MKKMNERNHNAKEIIRLEKRLKKMPVGMLTGTGAVETMYGSVKSLADIKMLPFWKEGMDFHILHNATLYEAYDDFLKDRNTPFTKECFEARWNELWPTSRMDRAWKRLTLEQALKHPVTREITGKTINSLNQSLELYHKEHDRGMER
jgi:hypothetical protein